MPINSPNTAVTRHMVHWDDALLSRLTHYSLSIVFIRVRCYDPTKRKYLSTIMANESHTNVKS